MRPDIGGSAAMSFQAWSNGTVRLRQWSRYGSVTLPYAVVVDELANWGTVWRTDRDDPACAVDAHKVGLDADGEPGGCDNVRLRIGDDGVQGSYFRPAD